MNISPRVSIVIPVYNGADYLAEAIDSALAQTYPNIEIIVVNDGSRDDGATEKIALSYGNRIRYFSKENGGVASALNLAIGKMQGEYFSWLSHDDLYYPEKVAAQIESLPDSRAIMYSDFAVFTQDPDEAQEISLSEVSPEEFRYFLTVENSLHGCTLLIPKVAFDECGNFNEKLRTTQDFDLWFRLAKKYKFVHIPRPLVKARRHEAQGSVQMKGLALAECNALLSGFVSELSEAELLQASGKSLSVSYARLYANLSRRGFDQAARCAFDFSWKNLPQSSSLDALMSISILLNRKLILNPLSRIRLLIWKLRNS
jgi:glycosyltransferase involved in cell wall biosynthesis